jgi:hypothetical protein
MQPVELDIQGAISMVRGKGEKLDAGLAAARRRAQDVTATGYLTCDDRSVRAILGWAIFGLIPDKSTGKEVPNPEGPVVKGFQLRSRLTKCTQCEDNKCGRAGQFHDIVYITGSRLTYHGQEIDGKVAKRMSANGIDRDIRVKCAVDPKTGLFKELVNGDEAVKILRQFGVGTRKPRYNEFVKRGQEHKVDMWVVDEPRFNELKKNVVVEDELKSAPAIIPA